MQNVTPQVSGLILAAGKGTRMGSKLPKVLCQLAGKTLLDRVYDTLLQVGINDICLILGKEVSDFEGFLQQRPKTTVCLQHERRGTADAVAAAYAAYPSATKAPYAKGSLHSGEQILAPKVLICYGDTPCLSAAVLEDFLQKAGEKKARLSLIGIRHPHPHGYGRILQDENGQLTKIVEEKDADTETKKVDLVNSGVLLADVSLLFSLLEKVDNRNAQSEYYLTDCFQICQDQGEEVFVYETDQYRTFDGVNTQEQLASLNQWFIENQVESH